MTKYNKNIFARAFSLVGKGNSQKIVESLLKRKILSTIESINNIIFLSNINI
jgi:hypothetical protein